MRALFAIILFAAFVLPPIAFAEVQTFTATHTYVLGDHDSKDDARQRCLLEAKRKILEQAGVYMESASEVKDLQLTKDKITSFAAAVMQVKDTKEALSFQQGQMTMTLKVTAQVDLEKVRKQLATRQVDAGLREDVAAQKERIRLLEGQLEAMMQRQQGEQSSPHAPTSPPIDISTTDPQRLHGRAAQGEASAQLELGLWYALGYGLPQNAAMARQWFEKAAAQGNASAQYLLGVLYSNGEGVPQDYGKARQWHEQAAAQGNASAQYALGALYNNGSGVQQDYAQAVKWIRLAVAQGDANAQFALGLLHHNGRGVQQDYVQAAYWYEKAAAQGHANAQCFLGVLYAEGNGVPRAYVRAYMWWSLAAAHSTGDLQKMSAGARDAVTPRMTPAQIAEAQRLEGRCQAQQFKGC